MKDWGKEGILGEGRAQFGADKRCEQQVWKKWRRE